MLARRHPARRAPAGEGPQVRLGTLAEGGLAPAIMAIVELQSAATLRSRLGCERRLSWRSRSDAHR